jgi:tetratricopeptide (TPR) repeat protein
VTVSAAASSAPSYPPFTGLVQGRARASTLLIIGWGHEMRGETAQLGDLAAEALRLARDSSDPSLESEAQCLLGDVLQDQGKPTAALAAFAESLAIRRQLSEQDPGNADWQRELAVAHSRVGAALQRQGELDKAQAAFDEYLAISRRLAGQDPDNAAWQRELALAHGRVGKALQAQKRPKEARAEFDEYLAISRRLVDEAPDNAAWQRELAVAHSSMGGMLQAQEKLTEARAAFGKSLTIIRCLAEEDPGNADLQRDLAVACLRLARVERLTSNNSKAALELYEESLRIFTDRVARAPERQTVEAELKAFREGKS